MAWKKAKVQELEPLILTIVVAIINAVLAGVIGWWGYLKKHEKQQSQKILEMLNKHENSINRIEDRHVTESQVHEIVDKSYKDLSDKMDKIKGDISESLDDIKVSLQAILIQQAQDAGYRKAVQEQQGKGGT